MRSTSPGPPDAELVRRVGQGDRDAFQALYRRHQGAVYRFASYVAGCQRTAEDVTQDVFLTLMRQPLQYDAARGSLPGYLLGMARHLVLARRRRDRRVLPLDEPRLGPLAERVATDGDPEARASANQAGERVRRAVRSLPAHYREVVVLCDLQDVDYRDAAAILDCPVGTVRSRLHRARRLLGEKLRPAGSRSATTSMIRWVV